MSAEVTFGTGVIGMEQSTTHRSDYDFCIRYRAVLGLVLFFIPAILLVWSFSE
jgi:hypothetical protein